VKQLIPFFGIGHFFRILNKFRIEFLCGAAVMNTGKTDAVNIR
jgi:hypothetical protein